MLILILFLIHCKQKSKSFSKNQILNINENQLSNIKFKFVKKINTEIISNPKIGMPESEDLIYYGLKNIQNNKSVFSVTLYSLNLDIISQKEFNFGQGPGDVGNNNYITLANNNIYISENSNLRVSIFNKKFDLIKIIKYKPGIMGSFYLYNNANLIISFLYNPKDDVNNEYHWIVKDFPDQNNIFKLTANPPYPARKEFLKGHKSLLGGNTEYAWFFYDNYIYIAIFGEYRILKIDLSGNIINNLYVNVNKLKTDNSSYDSFFNENGFPNTAKNMFYFPEHIDPVAKIIPLSKGFIAIRRINQFHVTCNNVIEGDYFNYQLEYQGKVKIPCMENLLRLWPIHNGIFFGYSNGFLFLIDEKDEFNTISKWEVIE
jgi:hypothetical protein